MQHYHVTDVMMHQGRYLLGGRQHATVRFQLVLSDELNAPPIPIRNITQAPPSSSCHRSDTRVNIISRCQRVDGLKPLYCCSTG